MKRYSTVLWVVILYCVSNALLFAEIPRSLSVQGILSNSAYDIDKVHIIKTTLYSAKSDDNVLFTQFDTLHIEKNGLFAINLGKDEGLPLSIPFDRQYVVEFSVNGIVMPMRMPLQSVPYAITSEKVSENSVELRHLSEDLKSVLQLNDDSEKGEMKLANYVSGHRAVIAGGDENRTSASYASILGGYSNSVTGTYGTIAGGQSNASSGSWSFVGGGLSNRALGTFTTVTAGANNIVSSSASYGSIGGGGFNQIGGLYATIAGGNSNTASGNYANIGGGNSNRTMQDFSTISGGNSNNAGGFASTIGGGINNVSSGQHSFIGGGKDNIAIGMSAVVAGGLSNNASGMSSGISSGQSNIVTGSHSIVSGGLNNRITSIGSIISGGINNSITTNYATVSGGSTNIIAANFGTISGGGSNTITSTATFSTISGGQNNIVQGRFSGIVGGFSNIISQNSSNTNVSGGDSNQITHTSSGISNNSAISGGRRNTISNSSFSSINGGRLNSLSLLSDNSMIGGGSGNSVSGSDHAVIAGGKSNGISTGSHGAAVSGGENNTIGTGSLHAFIGSGLNNAIGNNSMQSLIAGGNENTISNGSPFSSVLSGFSNQLNGDYSVLTGGLENSINGDHGYIGGGEINSITGSNGTIIGGRNNRITSNAEYGTIIGGRNNTVESDHAITIGQSNTVLAVNGIAIGQSNGTSSGGINSVSIGSNNNLSAAHSFAIGTGNIATSQHEFAIGAYSDDAFNPASTSNTSFTGNRKFSFGIGTSTSQRKNAITVFDHGNTLIQGKLMVTDTAFLNIASIANNTSIGGSVNIAGNLTIGGILSMTGTIVSSNLSGTNTGDITIGTANGLSLSGQVLSLDTATITSNGAMTFHDKVKLNALPNQISSGAFLPTKVTAEQRNALTNLEAGMIAFCSNCGLQGELQYYSGTNWATFTGDPVASLNGFSKTQIGTDINAISQEDHVGQINSIDLSYDGSVLAVGFPSNGAVNTNGLVKVFKWSGSSWIQLGSDVTGEAAYDQFGAAVSISNNGRILAIGAPQNDGGGSNAGSVRIYNWNDTTWTQEGSDIDGNSSNLQVGTNVDLSGDGKMLAILSSNAIFRFYRKSASIWSQVNSDIGLGRSISFSIDGRLVAVSDINHVNVYYDNGTNWTKKGGSHIDVNSETMANVSINHDGNIIAIGIPLNDANGSNAGKVKVMQWNGFHWINKGLDILGESAGDFFGFSVSLSSDGNKLIAGGPNNDGNGSDSGHARVYQWNGENWIQQNTDIDGEAAGDNCGSSVVISGDGTRVAIGATENDGGAVNGGHVRVFK
ncbi:MAG: hypothetical protein ACK5HH_02480 [Ignavibacteria bacterium]|jgi:hypothetical protein